MNSASFDRLSLLKAISLVDRVPSKKPFSDIVSCVKLSVIANANSWIEAVNERFSVRHVVEGCEAKKDFFCVFDPKKVREVLSKCKSKTISIDIKDGKIQINDSERKFVLFSKDADLFPSSEIPSQREYVSIQSRFLIDILKYTQDTCKTETSTPVFGSVCLTFEKDCIKCRSTQGREFSIFLVRDEFEGCFNGNSYNIPVESLRYVVSQIEKFSSPVNFGEHNNQVFFSGETFTVLSRTVEGRFPGTGTIESLIDSESNIKVEISPELFKDMIESVSLTCSELSRCILIFIEKDRIKMHSVSPDLGSSEVSGHTISSVDEKITIGLDWSFIIKFTNICDKITKKFIIGIPEKAKGEEQPNFVYFSVAPDQARVITTMRFDEVSRAVNNKKLQETKEATRND